MVYPTPFAPEAEAAPPPAPRSHDPLAVALGNASLLSVGYLMLGRRALFAVTALITLVLLIILTSSARSVGFEITVVVWWVALIAHGWLLARQGQRVEVPRQRLVALGLTVAMLLTVGLLRFDAAGIENSVTEARNSGDCTKAMAALDEVWLGHRMANAPLTVRGEKTVEACQRLSTAKDQLATATSDGDLESMKTGFAGLGSVLADLPGHEKMVDTTLDGFLGALPAKNPCDTVELTDWLRERPASNNGLDRSSGVVTRLAPPALAECGDNHMKGSLWEKARANYQQLIDQYPGHELITKVQVPLTKATQAIELAHVRSLVVGATATAQPTYCRTPAKYSGAPAIGPGANRALYYGEDEFTNKLPLEWRTGDVAEATLVVCVGEKMMGTTVQTCPYENKTFPQFPHDVAFRNIVFPVAVYELRTGKLLADTKVEIRGESCPPVLSYRTYLTSDLGPPGEVYVTASDGDVTAAFKSLISA